MSERQDYKKTINLPKTRFPMRANLAQREPEILKRWQADNTYEKALAAREGKPPFVFHDGPPYANGHIHYGHIMNKVLKDFVVKYHTLAGRYVRFVPGWDCHGLPIELGVERALQKKGKLDIGKLGVRTACRREADKWVKAQRKGFERLGVFGTWDKPYLTLNPGFEQGILSALSSFVRHDLVYRGKKPVHWCTRCRTALAEAEVEHQDHTSPSIYVSFPFEQDAAEKLAGVFGIDATDAAELGALIWTTTPWTLPANLAIAVNPEYDYGVFRIGTHVVVAATGLSESIAKAVGEPAQALGATVKGEALLGLVARHPFEDRASPILGADYVTLETGTGLVHTAPGHGADDYKLGTKHGLQPFAPVDAGGLFTDEVRPAWRGKHVLEANPEIVQYLHDEGVLLNPVGQSLKHSYPGCWRCKTPVIFRATTQWFIAMDRPLAERDDGRTLRDIAMGEIAALADKRDTADAPSDAELESGWIPAWGRDRIGGMIADRPDWCISRQRVWGVPIPALHCKACSKVHLTAELVDHVAALVGQEGTDVWYKDDDPRCVPDGFACDCGGTEFDRDSSILDVWFESGASFMDTLGDEEGGLGLPADLYLEGSDQHRGWFHSSLLVGAAVLGRAPYKRVLTHGFVCDDTGRPYSKSDIRRRQEAGEKIEYLDPADVVKQQGAELLRLWVAYEDFRSDVRYSAAHLQQVSEAYFKIRNTLRFLLGSLNGYEGGEPETLDPIDAWAQARMRSYLDEVDRAYARFDFRTVFHRTLELCTGDLSSFYMDVTKDRLYCEAIGSQPHLSGQSTVSMIARGLIASIAPVLAFTGEEAWGHLPGEEGRSVYLEGAITRPEIPEGDAALLEGYQQLREVIDVANLALEPHVKAGDIKHRREAVVSLTMPAEMAAAIGAVTDDLAIALAVASVEVSAGDVLQASVAKTGDVRCERCWRHRPDVGVAPAPADLCVRCHTVLQSAQG